MDLSKLNLDDPVIDTTRSEFDEEFKLKPHQCRFEMLIIVTAAFILHPLWFGV
jgi:hypothetical protein